MKNKNNLGVTQFLIKILFFILHNIEGLCPSPPWIYFPRVLVAAAIRELLGFNYLFYLILVELIIVPFSISL